ncbi:Tankyrase [Diplonema papillatum]|nr:Tankyrase [Diplonema papillatum]|eukprot:gene11366-17485_t
MGCCESKAPPAVKQKSSRPVPPAKEAPPPPRPLKAPAKPPPTPPVEEPEEASECIEQSVRIHVEPEPAESPLAQHFPIELCVKIPAEDREAKVVVEEADCSAPFPAFKAKVAAAVQLPEDAFTLGTKVHGKGADYRAFTSLFECDCKNDDPDLPPPIVMFMKGEDMVLFAHMDPSHRLKFKLEARGYTTSEDYVKALLTAAGNGDVELAEQLLTVEVDPNCREAEGTDTPLHKAAFNNQAAMADLLIDHGADVNVRTRTQDTPLHLGCFFGGPEVVEILLNRGADVQALNTYDESPLHRAARMGRVKTLKLVLGALRNISALKQAINARTKSGYTPLHELALGECQYTRPEDDGEVENVAKLLVGYGADPSAKDAKGETPLHMAAEHHRHDLITDLVGLGADVNAPNDTGDAPLHHASKTSDTIARTDTLSLLVDLGAELDLPNTAGCTALHKAAEAGHTRACQVLVDRGAAHSPENEEGHTPLYRAMWGGHKRTESALLELGAQSGKEFFNHSSKSKLHATDSG